MDLMIGAFRIFLLYIIFTNIIRIIYALVNRKKIIAKLEEVKNSEEMMEKPQMEEIEEIEYVTDPICKEKIDKDNAHIIVEEDENKYFCSWECRREYIESKNQN